MSTRPFYIPDTAPFLSWSPCVNCNDPNGGWASAYSPRGDGYDQTFHHTTSGNASLNFQIAASAISFDMVYEGDCPAVFGINGTLFGPACGAPSQLRDMPLGMHELELRTARNGAPLRINGIAGELPAPSGKEGERFGNMTVDNTDPSMSYSSGDWTLLDTKSNEEVGLDWGSGMA